MNFQNSMHGSECNRVLETCVVHNETCIVHHGAQGDLCQWEVGVTPKIFHFWWFTWYNAQCSFVLIRWCTVILHVQYQLWPWWCTIRCCRSQLFLTIWPELFWVHYEVPRFSMLFKWGGARLLWLHQVRATFVTKAYLQEFWYIWVKECVAVLIGLYSEARDGCNYYA